jgi:AbiJ N-terminal domain 4
MDRELRKTLSFAQAEGLAPLPSQLARTVMSKELRAKLWAYVHSVIAPAYFDVYHRNTGPWYEIFKDLHTDHFHYRIDKLSLQGIVGKVGDLFEKGEYHQVYGWLEFVLKHPRCPRGFADRIQGILEQCRAPYRVEDGVIWSISSPEEEATIRKAISDTAQPQFGGARTHLKKAASELTQGNYASSVRESISAVESVARVLEPTGDISKALVGLEQRLKIHPALKKGFLALYGYTSDESGIRHALLSNDGADVEETDAVFFIGACASFVSYLVAKSKSANGSA